MNVKPLPPSHEPPPARAEVAQALADLQAACDDP
jgi:hypothetical protein